MSDPSPNSPSPLPSPFAPNPNLSSSFVLPITSYLRPDPPLQSTSSSDLVLQRKGSAVPIPPLNITRKHRPSKDLPLSAGSAPRGDSIAFPSSSIFSAPPPPPISPYSLSLNFLKSHSLSSLSSPSGDLTPSHPRTSLDIPHSTSSSDSTPRDHSRTSSPLDLSPTQRGKLVSRMRSNGEEVMACKMDPGRQRARNIRQMKMRRRSFCAKKDEIHAAASLPLIEALSDAQMVLMAEKVRDAVAMRQSSQSSPFWDLVSGFFLGSTLVPSSSSSSSTSTSESTLLSSSSSSSTSASSDSETKEEEEVSVKGDKTYYYNVLLCDRAGGAVGLPVVLVFSSKRLKVLRGGSNDVMWSIPFSNIELFRLLAEEATLSLRFCPLGMQTYHTLYFYSSRVIEMYSGLVMLINAEIIAQFEIAKAKRIEKPLTPR